MKKEWGHHKTIFRYKTAGKFLKGKTVLDVGCGEGNGLYIIDRFSITGIDASKKALKEARKNPGKFFYMKVPPLKFPDNRFDNIVCAGMIQHLNSKKAAGLIKEFYRVLKKGGVLFLTTTNALNTRIKPRDHKEFTPQEMDSFFKKTPFESVYRGGYYWPVIFDFDRELKVTKEIKRIKKSGFLRLLSRIVMDIVWKIQIDMGRMFPSKAYYQILVYQKNKGHHALKGMVCKALCF